MTDTIVFHIPYCIAIISKSRTAKICRPSPDSHEKNEREKAERLEPQKARATRHEKNANDKAARLKQQAAYRKSLAHRRAEAERRCRQVPAGHLRDGHNTRPIGDGERTCADNGLRFRVDKDRASLEYISMDSL